MLWYFILCSVMPRIIPLSPFNARQLINKWIDEEKDADKILSLKKSRDLFVEFTDLGCIGIVQDDCIKSISLLDKDIRDNIMLINILSVDSSSGTMLMKAIVRINPNITLSSHVDNRWKIAYVYFKLD